MLSWQDMPTELRLRDAKLVSLSMQDVEALFNLATKFGVVDQFAELFWPAMSRARSNPTAVSIQQCVNLLEERKRSIGRAYDNARKKYGKDHWLTFYQAIKYNECEYNIRWLVDQYGCERFTKDYLLEV